MSESRWDRTKVNQRGRLRWAPELVMALYGQYMQCDSQVEIRGYCDDQQAVWAILGYL